MPYKAKCDVCGKEFDLAILDFKPARFADGKQTLDNLAAAADNGEDFEFKACEDCYGAGYSLP